MVIADPTSDPADVLAYVLMLLRAAVPLGLLLVLVVGAAQVQRFGRVLRRCLIGVAVVIAMGLVINLTVRAEEIWVVALLGSEDDRIAARVYDNRGEHISTDRAIRYVKSSATSQNARYYLCRILGERVASGDVGIAVISNRLARATEIQPRLFGTNRIHAVAADWPFPMAPVEIVIRTANYERARLKTIEKDNDGESK